MGVKDTRCRHCGAIITAPPYSNQRGRNVTRVFCSGACYRMHQRDQGVGNGGPRRVRSGSSSRLGYAPCSQCGRITVQHGKRLGALTRSEAVQCSDVCRAEHKRAVRRADQRRNYERRGKVNARRNQAIRRARVRGCSVVDRIDLRVLAERDHHACHVCGKQVDMARRFPDPKSPTVDHLVPISEQGDHSYANTRLAHLGCNMRRGTRGAPVQLSIV